LRVRASCWRSRCGCVMGRSFGGLPTGLGLAILLRSPLLVQSGLWPTVEPYWFCLGEIGLPRFGPNRVA